MSILNFLKQTALWLGIEQNKTSHSEKLISTLGATIGIALTILLTQWISKFIPLSTEAGLLIIASFGATAVLVFAVPHGALSQPWQVLAGHLLSAFVGVSCAYLMGATVMSAGLAVGLSVGVMYYARCIHPPGGATALNAVMGGAAITDLGYSYLVTPVLLNVGTILIVACLFNALFHWRRYPVHLASFGLKPQKTPFSDEDFPLTTEDFNAAIRELDSFVDLTEEGLSELLEKAKLNAAQQSEHPEKIVAGRFYSNGKIGYQWSVRMVIDSGIEGHKNDVIIYKNVAGSGLYETGMLDREAFRYWAKYEVYEHNGIWLKANKN
ncbi:HPP family protein [Methylophaga sp. OBS3]|uniref:HPP family protein n=1 Tax=Methylophaga sp. OBS3 TaxID=2991934 RepID=UPI00224FEBFC|nr:HPP family protein [Methylophaga sp. OBS3]MCX4189003.1 HPP family protein [Methylophaga sp. OBS3]